MANISDNILQFLKRVTDVSIGYNELNFYTPDGIAEGQIGYQVDESDMLNQGDWQKEWIVIATDQLGDPVFINLANTNLPVYTAMHGEGTWEPQCIASNLIGFEQIIASLNHLSAGRSNPVEFEDNPVSKPDRKAFLDKVKLWGADADYWEDFIEQ